jgi:hypothetical protein
MKRPFFLYFLFVLHLFLGIGAITGGGMLILHPDGSLLGMDENWLEHSPFRSYFIPGFLLFTFLGLFPLFTFIGLLLQPAWPWANTFNIFHNRH